MRCAVKACAAPAALPGSAGSQRAAGDPDPAPHSFGAGALRNSEPCLQAQAQASSEREAALAAEQEDLKHQLASQVETVMVRARGCLCSAPNAWVPGRLAPQAPEWPVRSLLDERHDLHHRQHRLANCTACAALLLQLKAEGALQEMMKVARMSLSTTLSSSQAQCQAMAAGLATPSARTALRAR